MHFSSLSYVLKPGVKTFWNPCCLNPVSAVSLQQPSDQPFGIGANVIIQTGLGNCSLA